MPLGESPADSLEGLYVSASVSSSAQSVHLITGLQNRAPLQRIAYAYSLHRPHVTAPPRVTAYNTG
jgi:hypothetical protein